MMELTRERLDVLEFCFLKEKPNATEEEIKEYLTKAPYSKLEIETYLKSQQRKELLKFLKKQL